MTRSDELATQPTVDRGSDTGALDITYDTYSVLGSRAAVGAASEDACAAIRGLLSGFGPVSTDADSGVSRYDLSEAAPGEWQVRVDNTVVRSGDEFAAMLGALEWQVISAAVGRSDEFFQLHGAALCSPTTRSGVVLIGDSGFGKTTLTLGLMLAGFVPFADDLSLLDPPTLELHAFRRAFHVSDETWGLIEALAGPLARGERLPHGHFSPPQWAEQPVPVRWLLFLDRRREQGVQLTPMSPAEAATAILAQSLNARRTARLALNTAVRLTQQARCYRFAPGTLAESITAIKELVATPGSVSAPRE